LKHNGFSNSPESEPPTGGLSGGLLRHFCELWPLVKEPDLGQTAVQSRSRYRAPVKVCPASPHHRRDLMSPQSRHPVVTVNEWHTPAVHLLNMRKFLLAGFISERYFLLLRIERIINCIAPLKSPMAPGRSNSGRHSR